MVEKSLQPNLQIHSTRVYITSYFAVLSLVPMWVGKFFVNLLNFTDFQKSLLYSRRPSWGVQQSAHYYLLLYWAIASSEREFSTRAMLSKFAERDNPENQGHGSNAMSPGEVLAIVIAALTLLVAMIPLFRCPRFQRWPLSSISPFFKVYLPLLVLSKHIHVHILNLAILHRKLLELLF